MIELKVINKEDPIRRKAKKQEDVKEYSPMDPPDAYAPPNMEEISLADLHPFLIKLMDEHKMVVEKLNDFEKTLLHIQDTGIDKNTNQELGDFFTFFDESIVAHNQKEEKQLFPLLQKRFLENGDHGSGKEPVTAIDMLEEDHIKIHQLAAVVFNFFGLTMRLPDLDSRLIVLDAAIEQGKVLVELLKLHIFREDNVVFPLAHKYIRQEEFELMDDTIEKK